MTSDTTSHLDLTLMVAEGQGDLPRTRRAPRIDKIGSGGIHMGRWRTLVAVALAVGLAVVLAGCQQGEKAAGNVRAGPAGAGAVRVLMQDNTFQPQALEVRAGSPVTVEVRNAGDKSHNFTIDSLNVSTGAMHHGDVKTVTFTAPKGSMEFSCTWHRGMVGRIVAT
jgi:plastocyanin